MYTSHIFLSEMLHVTLKVSADNEMLDLDIVEIL